jgi:hypothetical protein
MPNQSDPNQNQQTNNNPQGITTPPVEDTSQVVVPDFQATEIPSIATDTQTAAPTPPDKPTDSLPVEPPPPIISSTPKKKFGGGKIIATILGFLILAGGIVGGVILTQQQQDIRERAGFDEGGITGQTSNTAGGPGNSGGDDGGDDGGGDGGDDGSGSSGSSSGSSTSPTQNNQPAGICVDVNCALTYNENAGTYFYNSSMDQPIYNPDTGEYEDEEIDGMPVYDYYQSVVSTGDGTGGLGDSCTNDSYCANGYTCVSGTCQGNPITSTCGRDLDPGAPVCCTSDSCTGGQWVCEVGNRLECNTGGVHCTKEAESSACQGVNPGEPPDNPPSSPPTSGAQCLNVKAYSSTWTLYTLTQLSGLRPNDVVNFCVAGSLSSGAFDQAEFKIGSATKTNVTAASARPGSTNEYCQSYTILSTDTTINVKARIHHGTLGWFGESI